MYRQYQAKHTISFIKKSWGFLLTVFDCQRKVASCKQKSNSVLTFRKWLNWGCTLYSDIHLLTCLPLGWKQQHRTLWTTAARDFRFILTGLSFVFHMIAQVVMLTNSKPGTLKIGRNMIGVSSYFRNLKIVRVCSHVGRYFYIMCIVWEHWPDTPE